MSLCVAGSTGIDWNRNRLQELQECENKKRILLLSFFQAKKKQGAIIHIWWRLFRLSRSVFGGILQLCPLGAVLKVTCYKQVSDKLYQGLSWKEKGGTESFSFAAGRLWEENPFSHQLWPVRHFLGEAEHEFLRAAVRSGGGAAVWQSDRLVMHQVITALSAHCACPLPEITFLWSSWGLGGGRNPWAGRRGRQRDAHPVHSQHHTPIPPTVLFGGVSGYSQLAFPVK